MIRRRSLPLLLLTAGALVAAMAAPAAAGSGGGSKPSATSMLAKGSRAAASASTVQRAAEAPGETDADEAENLRARDAFLQSITAAPAVVAPMNALVAARSAADHLPSYGGPLGGGDEEALRQRPDQPRRQLRRGLGSRHRPHDGLHGRRTRGLRRIGQRRRLAFLRPGRHLAGDRPRPPAPRRSAPSPPTPVTARSGSEPASRTTAPRASTAWASTAWPAARTPGAGSAGPNCSATPSTGSPGSRATSTRRPGGGCTGGRCTPRGRRTGRRCCSPPGPRSTRRARRSPTS